MKTYTQLAYIGIYWHHSHHLLWRKIFVSILVIGFWNRSEAKCKWWPLCGSNCRGVLPSMIFVRMWLTVHGPLRIEIHEGQKLRSVMHRWLPGWLGFLIGVRSRRRFRQFEVECIALLGGVTNQGYWDLNGMNFQVSTANLLTWARIRVSSKYICWHTWAYTPENLTLWFRKSTEIYWVIAKLRQGKGSDKALGTSERWTDGGMKLMKPSHSRPRWVREILKEHFPGRQMKQITCMICKMYSH